MLIRRLALRTVIVALPGLALAFGPGTALGTSPSFTLQFHNQAPLQPDGSVLLTVDYTCMPGAFSGTNGVLELELQQTNNAVGSFTGPAACDDQKHTTTADVGPGPFVQGDAAALGVISNDSGFADTQVELKVT